ncbi:hypothetical protein ACJQWK_08492 [Exserohilum turcicum]
MWRREEIFVLALPAPSCNACVRAAWCLAGLPLTRGGLAVVSWCAISDGDDDGRGRGQHDVRPCRSCDCGCCVDDNAHHGRAARVLPRLVSGPGRPRPQRDTVPGGIFAALLTTRTRQARACYFPEEAVRMTSSIVTSGRRRACE